MPGITAYVLDGLLENTDCCREVDITDSPHAFFLELFLKFGRALEQISARRGGHQSRIRLTYQTFGDRGVYSLLDGFRGVVVANFLDSGVAVGAVGI